MRFGKSFSLQIYLAPNGERPFVDWLEALDKRIRFQVKERLDRLAMGNWGDWKRLQAGVYELRLHFGAGYRLYFGRIGASGIVLLCGGAKVSQRCDIARAKRYWIDYLSR